MVVGVCRLALVLEGISSLKAKRAVVRRVVDRTAHRYNVAIAEVDAQDVYERAVLGFAVVSESGKHAQRMLDDIVSFIAGLGEAPVRERSSELVPFNDRERLGPVACSWSDFEEEE